MSRREELNVFLERADELIASKYILADVKIVNLLKAIAASEAMVAVFKNCLNGFDFAEAKKKYFVKSKYLNNNKYEYVYPSSSREVLAFTFNVLMDLDAKRIQLSELLNSYFYVDGSTSAGYAAFLNTMIVPFRDSVKVIMESIIDGSVQDPIEALTLEEERLEKEKREKEEREKKERELSKKTYAEAIKKIKQYLFEDKEKISASKLDDGVKEELILVGDMLANVVDSEDKDALNYAFIAYKYVCRAYPRLFRKREKQIGALVTELSNEI